MLTVSLVMALQLAVWHVMMVILWMSLLSSVAIFASMDNTLIKSPRDVSLVTLTVRNASEDPNLSVLLAQPQMLLSLSLLSKVLAQLDAIHSALWNITTMPLLQLANLVSVNANSAKDLNQLIVFHAQAVSTLTEAHVSHNAPQTRSSKMSSVFQETQQFQQLFVLIAKRLDVPPAPKVKDN